MWLTNPTDGAYAQVDQADVDSWRLRGWQPMDVEPTGRAMVWLHHEATGNRAKFPATVVEQWSARGWAPGAPPEPVDLTKDPRLTDQPAEPEPETPKPAGRASRAGRQTQTEE